MNLPSKVRKVVERDVAPLLNLLHPTSENNQRTHSDLFDFFMRDFPCDTDYVEIEDVVNPTTEMKGHSQETDAAFIGELMGRQSDNTWVLMGS